MASPTAQSLLNLPAGATDPSPYAVFGLLAGERDPAVIQRAIQATITRLREAKPATDPVVWQQAAAWVKRARSILLDPMQKAQLDQKVERDRAKDAAPAPATPTAAAIDPLAGLLPAQAAAPQTSTPASDVADGAPALGAAQFRAGPVPAAAANPVPAAAVAPVPTPTTDAVSPSAPTPADLGAELGGGPAAELAKTPAAEQRAAFELQDERMPAGELLAAELPRPVVKGRSVTARRRRRFPWAAVVLGSLVLISVGGIGGLIYVLTQNPGGIVVNIQSPTAATTGSAAPPRPPQPEPPPSERRPAPDPVMGSLGTAPAPQPQRPRGREQLAAADDWLASLAEADGRGIADADPEPSGAAPAPSMVDSAPSMADSGPGMVDSATSEPSSPAAGAMAALSPGGGAAQTPAGDPAAAQNAIEAARQAIAQADWEQMVARAEAAQQAAVTAEQKQQAAGLFQLAELASYYHGGIEKGLEGLGAGESFDVTDQLQIVVVEVAAEKVIVRFSGRNKEYPRRELPLVLAHRIAKFSIADSPTATAAGHAYQAVAPVATPQYRQQAIRGLQEMTAEIEGASAAEVAAAIKDVFGL